MICSLKDSSPSKGNYFQFTSNLVIYEPKLTCLITNYLSSSELAVNCCNKHYLVSEMNLRTESYQGLGPCMLRSFVFLFKIENGTICVFFVKKKNTKSPDIPFLHSDEMKCHFPLIGQARIKWCRHHVVFRFVLQNNSPLLSIATPACISLSSNNQGCVSQKHRKLKYIVDP